MEVLKNNYKLIIAFIIGIIVSASTAYMTTTKALTANGYLVYSSDVEYKDNSSLGVTNVQAAIDGTCTKFNNQLTELKKSMYPVGSVYISTTLSTTTAVASALGGTWEVYGTGKVLKGTTGTAGTTGGSNTVKLTTSNLPSHTHSYTPSESVSSTFTGSAATSGNNSATPTAKFTGTRAQSESAGAHTHNLSAALYSTIAINAGNYHAVFTAGTDTSTVKSAGTHSHYYTPSGTVSLSSTTHTHSVTAKGSVSSSFSGTASTTGATGYDSTNITAVNVEDAYITVYMYRRTA